MTDSTSLNSSALDGYKLSRVSSDRDRRYSLVAPGNIVAGQMEIRPEHWLVVTVPVPGASAVPLHQGFMITPQVAKSFDECPSPHHSARVLRHFHSNVMEQICGPLVAQLKDLMNAKTVPDDANILAVLSPVADGYKGIWTPDSGGADAARIGLILDDCQKKGVPLRMAF